MGAYGAVALAANSNIGYQHYPAVWEDSGKIYVKGQGELDVNIFDIATGQWSSISLPSATPIGQVGTDYVESCPLRQELIWVSGDYIYHLVSGSWSVSSPYWYTAIDKCNKTTGARVTSLTIDTVTANGECHGNWGRNRHKAVVKDSTGRIFIINFYLKKIYEFFPSTFTISLFHTWTNATFGGISTNDVSGCDAVCVDGDIILLGKMGLAITTGNGGTGAGPIHIRVADKNESVGGSYPDYSSQSAQTYNSYYGTQWGAIGNKVFGFSGKIYGLNALAGDGTGDGPFNNTDILLYDPSSGVKAFGANAAGTSVGDVLQFASTASYGPGVYIMAGIAAGTGTQQTLELTYLPTQPVLEPFTYNPSAGTVTIHWTCAEQPDFFQIYRKLVSETVYTPLGATADGTATSYTDATGLAYSYDYVVYAMKLVQ